MAKPENLFPTIAQESQLSLFGDGMADGYSYQSYIAALIEDAVDYDESELSPVRVENMRYYYGDLPALDITYDETLGGYEAGTENRSTAVSSEVQDTVMAMLPSLIRIFCASEDIAYCAPTRPDNVELAKQQTDYLNTIFHQENEGFLLLHSWFKDALTSKIGIAQWYIDDTPVPEFRTYHNITEEQLNAVIADWTEGNPQPDIEIVNPEEAKKNFDPRTGMIKELTLKYLKSSPRHCIEACPPEEFRIDRRAKSVKTSMLVGRDQVVPIIEVMAKGISQEDIEEFGGSGDQEYREERQTRTPGIDQAMFSSHMVRYGEYYIRVDKDQDGYAELRKICTIGDNHHIVYDEPTDHVRFAVFCGDPRPHTVIGDAVADLVKKLQNINTQLLRGALDSMSGSMFPDTYFNEYTVNIEDMMNDEVGRQVRVKGDPTGAVHEHRVTFNGAAIFDMMAQIDMIRQRRTGISEASKGIDPKALQSTNITGIEAIVTGAQERIELVARIFAETGFKDLFQGLLRDITFAPNVKKAVEVRGKWINVDTSLFDPNLSIRINPTLARGSDISRLAALSEVRNTQLMIIEKFGPGNPIVTPFEFMNTIEDMLALSNIKNINRYFRPVTEELVQQLQTAPKEPSPEELIAKAEMEKIKAQTAKALAELKQKDNKTALDEDFRRDKLELDTLVDLIAAIQKSTDKAADIEIARLTAKEGNTRDATA